VATAAATRRRVRRVQRVPDDSRDAPLPLPADEYLIRRVSAARHGTTVRLQDYAAAVFMRDAAAICEIPRIEDENERASEGDNAYRPGGRSS